MKRILLYVGSFSPPTFGHRDVAQKLAELEEFDEVWVQPSYKNSKPLLPGNDRIGMLRLLIKETDKLKISNAEIEYQMVGYTYEVLEQIKNLYPEYLFSLALGSDNVQDIDRWRYADKLISEVTFVVVPRTGYRLKSEGEWYNDPRHVVLDQEIMNVSSTELREALDNDQTLRALEMTSQGVLDYLRS